MIELVDVVKNHLLAALPDADLQRWMPHLEQVDLELGQVIFEAGSEPAYVYFPTDSIISLLHVMLNGASAEIAITGNEGIVGIALFMGGASTLTRAVVQSAGRAIRMRGKFIYDEFHRSTSVMHLLMRFFQALLAQTSQTAVCNRHHTLHQQLCRWLLLSADRINSNTLVMTQELIANMIGVRRETVTEAAQKMQRLGLIQYRRGQIMITDRAGLERESCECYEVVKKEYARLFPLRPAKR